MLLFLLVTLIMSTLGPVVVFLCISTCLYFIRFGHTSQWRSKYSGNLLDFPFPRPVKTGLAAVALPPPSKAGRPVTDAHAPPAASVSHKPPTPLTLLPSSPAQCGGESRASSSSSGRDLGAAVHAVF